MSQSLIKTDVKKLVRDLMKNKSDGTSDEEVRDYVNFLIKKEKQPEISMEQFKQYMEGSIYG